MRNIFAISALSITTVDITYWFDVDVNQSHADSHPTISDRMAVWRIVRCYHCHVGPRLYKPSYMMYKHALPPNIDIFAASTRYICA